MIEHFLKPQKVDPSLKYKMKSIREIFSLLLPVALSLQNRVNKSNYQRFPQKVFEEPYGDAVCKI